MQTLGLCLSWGPRYHVSEKLTGDAKAVYVTHTLEDEELNDLKSYFCEVTFYVNEKNVWTAYVEYF